MPDILWGRDSNVFNKKSRMQLFRTWGSLTAMLPKGGTALWGNDTYAPEDDDPEDVGGDDNICVTSSEPHGHVSAEEAEQQEQKGDEGGAAAQGGANGAAGNETAGVSSGGRCELGVRPVTKHGQVIGFTGNLTSKNWTVEEVSDNTASERERGRSRGGRVSELGA